MLECQAEQWPAEARQAEIRLWCKPTRTPISGELALAAIANLPPEAGEGFPLPAAPGVAFQARTLREADGPGTLRVAIVERHSSDSAGVGSLKLEINAAARRIVRQFDAANRLALHTFYFEGLDDEETSALRIEVTRRDEIEAGSWRLDEPLIVDVAGQADLLQLIPPKP